MGVTTWRTLPIPEKADLFKMAIRLNSLGSLYFFEKFVLGRSRLTERLHKPILQRLEADPLRYLIEMPRDHFKSVMVTEGRTIWRSLPFNETDEVAMRELGYGDEWVRWMKRIHNPARRTLIVTETIGNAERLGTRFNWHYLENKMFRHVFADILPTDKCVWNSECKTHLCADHGPNGEGTYDFLGVGAALQSRHYLDVVEDDVVGKDALESELVMNKTVDYHRLLIGAFESFATGTWTVVNNRWAPNDLSGWIRDNQKQFIIESHGALGGCCPEHPAGQPIFPEEYSLETLDEIRQVEGPFFFSHQYLNLPVAPEECVFKPDWLRFYAPVPSPSHMGRHWLHHEVVNGEVIADVNPNVLIRSMVVDPNHAGKEGRCRHAIIITGFDPETDRIYLLDVWAESMGYDDLCINIYKMANEWGLADYWLETVAAQKYLKYHLEYRNKIEKRSLHVNGLPPDNGKNAKRTRIEALEPVLRQGRLWVRHDQREFLTEYYAYPGGRTKDILDCLGYAPYTWNAIHAKNIRAIIQQRRERYDSRRTRTGY